MPLRHKYPVDYRHHPDTQLPPSTEQQLQEDTNVLNTCVTTIYITLTNSRILDTEKECLCCKAQALPVLMRVWRYFTSENRVVKLLMDLWVAEGVLTNTNNCKFIQ